MVIVDLKEQAGIAMNVRGQFSDPIVDPKVTLGALAFASEMGRLLWRMKYGQDVKRTGLHRATLLLAKRVRDGNRFDRSKFTGVTVAARRTAARTGRKVEREMTDIVERFTRRVIIEWVADLCVSCDGRGVVGRNEAALEREAVCPACLGERRVCVDEFFIPFAARRNGTGPIAYREYERCDVCTGSGRIMTKVKQEPRGRQICGACHGTGRAPVDHAARAIALGVPLTQYREHWEHQFVAVLALVDTIDGAANDTMQRRLRR